MPIEAALASLLKYMEVDFYPLLVGEVNLHLKYDHYAIHLGIKLALVMLKSKAYGPILSTSISKIHIRP
jgi:hypothetical protein